MRTNSFQYSVFLSLFLSGCSFNHDARTQNFPTQDDEVIVLQKRSETLTKQVSKKLPLIFSSASPLRSLYDESPYRYIGHGYKVGNGVIGDPNNLTFPIVNINGILNDDLVKDNINRVSVRAAVSEVYAFSDYATFLSTSKNTNKIGTKFSLPTLLPFKFGFESSFETTFETKIDRKKKQLRGFVNLYYRESNVKLNTASFTVDKITEKHLSRSFIGNLYNSSIYNVIQNYGGYVVCDYAVGGRASGTYLYNYSESSESIKQRFKNTLDFSFGWGDNEDASSIGFNTKRVDTQSEDNVVKKEDIYNKIQVIGGDPRFVINTSVAKINDNNVDLSGWISSLVDNQKLVMIDINDRGLLGLDFFVIEENYQKLIRDINDGLNRPQRLELPFISIEWINSNSTKQIAGVLNTRNGDKIIFLPHSKDNRNTAFLEEAKKIGLNMSETFKGIEVLAKSNGSINPLIRTKNSCVVIPYEFSELNWKKYKIPASNVIFIYDPSKRIAFSFYDEEYIPEVYGLSAWLKSLPEKEISISMIKKLYRVIGL